MGGDNIGFDRVREHRDNPEYGWILPTVDKTFGNRYGKQVEELLGSTDDPWAADEWVAILQSLAEEKAKAFAHLGTEVWFLYPEDSNSSERARATYELIGYWHQQMTEAARAWQFSIAQHARQGLVAELETLYARLEQTPTRGTVERVDLTPILP